MLVGGCRLPRGLWESGLQASVDHLGSSFQFWAELCYKTKVLFDTMGDWSCQASVLAAFCLRAWPFEVSWHQYVIAVRTGEHVIHPLLTCRSDQLGTGHTPAYTVPSPKQLLHCRLDLCVCLRRIKPQIISMCVSIVTPAQIIRGWTRTWATMCLFGFTTFLSSLATSGHITR